MHPRLASQTDLDRSRMRRTGPKTATASGASGAGTRDRKVRSRRGRGTTGLSVSAILGGRMPGRGDLESFYANELRH
jgi:hypothetical protein